jgi:hypothetical protein
MMMKLNSHRVYGTTTSNREFPDLVLGLQTGYFDFIMDFPILIKKSRRILFLVHQLSYHSKIHCCGGRTASLNKNVET